MGLPGKSPTLLTLVHCFIMALTNRLWFLLITMELKLTADKITFFQKNYLFGCSGSLLLLGLFSSCQQWGLLSSRGAWDSCCVLLQSMGCMMLGLQQFQHVSLVVWALGRYSTGSVVVSLGLSCPEACGIILEQNPCLPHLRVDSLALHQERCPHIIFEYRYFIKIGLKVFYICFLYVYYFFFLFFFLN